MISVVKSPSRFLLADTPKTLPWWDGRRRIDPLIFEKILKNHVAGDDLGDSSRVRLDHGEKTERLMKPASARGQGLKRKPCLQIAVPPKHHADSADDVVQDFGPAPVGPAVRRGEIILKIDHLHHDQRGGHDGLQRLAGFVLGLVVIVEKGPTVKLEASCQRPASNNKHRIAGESPLRSDLCPVTADLPYMAGGSQGRGPAGSPRQSTNALLSVQESCRFQVTLQLEHLRTVRLGQFFQIEQGDVVRSRIVLTGYKPRVLWNLDSHVP